MTAGWQSGAAPSGVLPPQELLGRDDDAARLRASCAERRVVSLLGAGGTGKTTLAAAVAPAAAAAVGATAWWVDLQRLPPGGDVSATVGEVMGVDLDAASSPVRRLARVLGDQAVLLVLDNCEHLTAEVAATLASLLPACGGLRVLATSREPLGVPGEQPVRLEPLPVPAGTAATTVEQLRGHAATELFLLRSGLDADALDDRDRRAVVGICRQLDGLPLAIELAAARSPTLAPTAIERALEDRFRLLTSRRPTVADRQRTLEASIGWSHDLLDPDEQRLLRSLAVFPARFDLAAAAVAGADGDELTATDLLTGLVDRSLVVVEERPSGRRYRLLESVRAFGEQQLRERDELAGARDRHVAATRERLRALALSDGHEGLVLRGDPWVAEEFDDVRAAALWAAVSDRPGTAVDLWWAVHVWAYAHGRISGPRAGVLAISPDRLDDRGQRRRAIMAIPGTSTMVPGDMATGEQLVRTLWDDRTPDPDRPITAFIARLWLVSTRTFALDTDPDELVEAAHDLLAVAGSNDWGDLVEVTSGLIAARALDLTTHHRQAHAMLTARLDAAERTGSPALVAYSRGMMATIAGKLALPEARQHLEASLEAMPAGWRHVRLGMLATSGVIVTYLTGDVEFLRQQTELHRSEAGAPGSGSWLHVQALDAILALLDGRDAEAIEIIDGALGAASRRSPMDDWLARDVRVRALARTGPVEEALAAAEDHRARRGTVHDRFVVAAADIGLMEARLLAGDPAGAIEVAAETVPGLVEAGQLLLLPSLALVTARGLAQLGKPEDAARALGRVAGHFTARNATVTSDVQARANDAEAAARAALGDEAFDTAFAVGRDLTWEDWAAWLGRGGGSRDSDRPVSGWDALTPTELEVARYAAAGLSTAEVAEVMFVSPNTVKTHLKHIYTKLDVHSRVELAGVVDEHDDRGG